MKKWSPVRSVLDIVQAGIIALLLVGLAANEANAGPQTVFDAQVEHWAMTPDEQGENMEFYRLWVAGILEGMHATYVNELGADHLSAGICLTSGLKASEAAITIAKLMLTTTYAPDDTLVVDYIWWFIRNGCNEVLGAVNP